MIADSFETKTIIYVKVKEDKNNSNSIKLAA